MPARPAPPVRPSRTLIPMLQGDQHDDDARTPTTTGPMPAARPDRTAAGTGAAAGIGAAIGLAAAVLGLLPWIVTGMHLPLQNLWETSVADQDAMPIALLPFNQYFVTFLAALLLTGAGAAGVAARLLRARIGRPGVFVALTVVLLVQVVAVVQTTAVTTAGLGMDRSVGTGGSISASEVYVVAFVVGSVLAVLLGAGVFLLLALAREGAAVVALAVSAVAFAEWVRGFVLPPATLSDPVQVQLADWAWWLAPVVVGVGIAATGLRSVGRVIGSVLALVVLLVGPALVSAASGASGMRVLLPYPLELFAFAGGLFTGSLARGLVAVLLAAVVGAVGALVVRRRGQRTTAAA